MIPRRQDCTDAAVREAMEFLCDEWLCDVATDYAGKCTLIAAALTVIERSLLPDRPAFFVTAGRRGGGKTTTLTMLIMAVTGIWPAAAAWSTNEEERRKALLSYFLYGVGYILWDNIPRGTQIACPHIEKSCTAAYYSDRKLGVSEMVATAASTIHSSPATISGRAAISPPAASTSASTSTAPIPKTATFKHPDPVGWTEDHRAEILRALYTILLGNPELEAARGAEAKTRFKMWWRLVGSAVEHAAKLASDSELDFQELFLSQEEDDEETALARGRTHRHAATMADIQGQRCRRPHQPERRRRRLGPEDPARNERGQRHAAGFSVRTRPSRLRGDAKRCGQAAAGPYRRARESRQSNPGSAPIHGSRQR